MADPIEIELERQPAWNCLLKIRVPITRIAREREKVVQTLRKSAKIPGFRNGRAPADLIQRRYRGRIEGETLEAVIQKAVEEAMEREALHPITQASVENVRYEKESPLEFEARFDIRPEIDLKRYTDFKIDRDEPAVRDEEVDEAVRSLRERRATYHEIDAAAAEGHRVTIDYTPVDPEKGPLEKQTVSDHSLILGDHTILPDIESGLYGGRAGDSTVTTVRYPDDYHRDELRGTTREFRVAVRRVEEKRLPEMDEPFLQSFGTYPDEAAFRDHVRSEILREKRRAADRAVEERLLENIIDANPFEVPASMIDGYVEGFIESLHGPRPEEEERTRLDEKIRPVAEKEVKKNLIIDLIMEKEGLTPTEEELERRVEALAEETGQDSTEVKRSLAARPEERERLRRRVAREKVFAFLVQRSEIVGT